ncbi:MAG TPA: hypothetical protein VGG98_11140 [Solirubrobacteraceae bacterium]|jgi:hypothetical protein
MRRAFTCLALLGLAVTGLSASASAAPTVTLKAKAVPIPGFPGTGNKLGAGAAVLAEYTISGTEYGGFPPPLVGVTFYLPRGVKLHPQGFATCNPNVIRNSGPGPCPRKSIAGPKGEASGIVSFGTERVKETVSVQPFFAPGGGLEFYVNGTTPVSIEILSTGHITNSSPPFGPKLVAEVPLIESVPGALDASALSIKVKVGAAYRKGRKTISYGTMPKKCPKGGFPVKSELTFLGGVTVPASYKAPCPPRSRRHR